MENLVERVEQLVSDVLDVSPGQITADMVRDDIPEWDSLAHLRVVSAIEEEFAIRFKMSEIAELRSIADIVQHLGAA